MKHGYRITRVVTPATSLALVSLDDAKAALGIDAADISQDAALTAQIEATSMAINNWCDRIFVVQVYRDQIRNACGAYGEPLVTRQYPIVVDSGGVPLVAVAEDGGAVDAAMLEVYPEAGEVFRLDATALPSAWGAALVVVDYTAGFEVIPADVQGACLEWLTARWHAVGRDPALRSETIPDLITQVYAGDGGAGTSAGAMPPGARDLLGPYKVWNGMTPKTAIAGLDAAIAGYGQSVTLERTAVDANGAISVAQSVTCPAAVRPFGPQDLEAGGVVDIQVRLSPTGLGAFGVPLRDDRILIDGDPANIVQIAPLYYGGALCRVNLLCRG